MDKTFSVVDAIAIKAGNSYSDLHNDSDLLELTMTSSIGLSDFDLTVAMELDPLRT